ncbi:response regulator transcription factor [Paenibacillus sp. OAS669]|uniref:response regulator transcription factor n=1 Tax=Paenibacillus sp. OAS669 TaxID=2663821 RepID=UPI00178A31F1|nr:response regulator transcription factor [Paenibacillus sp. OAS669]MBE1444961.1 two-component system response regulator YesN [Paenibacillus sp. OAS669]
MWKVLIVDDDFQVLEGMRKAIPWEQLDAEWVGEAMDGEEGLAAIRAAKPDIVITDIYMPVMNGLEMIEQLRNEQFAGEILILSGYSDFQYARQALRLQVTDYLSKPITVAELRTVMERVIKELEAKEWKKLEQEEIRRRLRLYEPFVQKEWLKSVVTGTFDRELADESLRLSDKAYWTHRNHVVIGIELMSTLRISNVSLTDWSLFRFAVANIIRELLAEEWPEAEFVELHSHHAAIVCHVMPETAAEEALLKLRSIGERIRQCIREYLKLEVRIGFGGLKHSWKEMANSTEEAFLDLLRQTISAKQPMDSYSGGREIGIRPVKFYQELAEAIVYSKEETTDRIIEGYVRQLKDMQGLTPAYVQYLCKELWTIFAYSLYNTGIVLDELFEASPVTEEIAGIGTADELEQWLKGKIRIIVSSRGWTENSRHKDAVDFMIHYAHSRYAEDINLEDLSKQLYLSRNYLNQIFKKATGETFTNYVIRVRMEKARALLIEGKLMIYEISEKVGYKNVPYFSSIFKKYYGMNPSEVGKKPL